MSNLVQNPGFENVVGNNFADWNEIVAGVTIFDSNISHSGDHAALITALGTISQGITGLIPGNLYTLSFWAASAALISVLSVTIGDILSEPIDIWLSENITLETGLNVYQLYSFDFVPTTTTGTLTFAGVEALGSQLIDDVSIILAAVCYSGNSTITTKNILTGEVKNVNASEVVSDIHQVYSINKQEYIPIKLNIITGPTNKFRLIKKDALGINQPSDDFYITPGHTLLIDGKEIKARDIPQSKRIKNKNAELVYSICTDERETILVNNLQVIAWGYEEWMKRVDTKKISWRNNSLNNKNVSANESY